MASKKQIAGITLGVILVVAATTYTLVMPYNRIAGIRIGGTLTAPPPDFAAAFKRSVGQIKTGGFPPFVVNVSLVPSKEGVITSTRPDGGYWSQRARIAPNGYVRSGDSTFAMKATEVLDDAKIPHLTAMFGPDMNRRLSGGVIIGESEPVGEWQVFLWTPR
jgi:hypothetical protein